MQLHLKTLYTLTVIFYVNPKLTTKNIEVTHIHKKTQKGINICKIQKNQQNTTLKETREEDREKNKKD